jgi:hypothetical protein
MNSIPPANFFNDLIRYYEKIAVFYLVINPFVQLPTWIRPGAIPGLDAFQGQSSQWDIGSGLQSGEMGF